MKYAVTAATGSGTYPFWATLLTLGAVITMIPLTIFYGKTISPWIIPCLMLALLAFGYFRGVPVYEVFVDGAKDGFQVAIRIIPYLVAILVAVGMFRASGDGVTDPAVGSAHRPNRITRRCLTNGNIKTFVRLRCIWGPSINHSKSGHRAR